jgi:nuclear pore complex protein Nup155
VAGTCESSRLHLLAVTADGRRVYFSTWHAPLYGSGAYGSTNSSYGSTYGSGTNGAYGSGTSAAPGAAAAGGGGTPGAGGGAPAFARRPETLVAVAVRGALPHSGAARGTAADLSRCGLPVRVQWPGCGALWGRL